MLNRARREPVVKEGWAEAGTLLPGSESALSLFSLLHIQEIVPLFCDKPAAWFLKVNCQHKSRILMLYKNSEEAVLIM